MWYSSPGSNNMTQSLLIGNGRMGAIVPGGVAQDTLILNENSLWSGTANLSGGYSLGTSGAFGSYQMFGSLVLNLPSHTNSAGYVRALDIGTGIATVDYTNNGVAFHRELFCSAPDQVMVMQLTANSNAAYAGSIQLTDAHSTTTSNTANGLMFSGALANAEKYEAQVVVTNSGGTLTISGGKVTFTNCNSLTIRVALGTDYVMDYSKSYHGNNPHTNVLAQATAASAKTFSTLETAHTNDFTALFNRVSIWLGDAPSARTNLPTDQRITTNATSDDDTWMEQLMFQYGRYLMISSSRGGLPMNLCGLWNDNNNDSYSYWGDDYHSDINIEMMYWQAEVANLPECFDPFSNWLQSQIPAWRYVTTNASTSINNGGYGYGFGGTNGWTTRTSHNINGGQGWNWIQSGNAWYCMHLWEHYAFNGDTDYLRNVAYPAMKETCQFWQQHLQQIGSNTNGLPVTTLVATNGWSPEHGPWENGVSFDQELIWDVFNNYQQACAILHTDAVYSATVSNLQANLLVPGVGSWGELREWLYNPDSQTDDHRHTMHLVGVYPGHQFTSDQTSALAAAKVGLLARGDTGDSAAEWAHAWRIPLFARMLDPVDAHHKLALYCGTVYPNLVASLGGIPQLDGSCGVTAGIAEMLLQSHEGRIALLPSLPTNWPAGSVTGLRARGGFTVDMFWTNGWLTAATIHSVSGTNCAIQYGSQTIQTNIPLGGSVQFTPTGVSPGEPWGLQACAGDGFVNLSWTAPAGAASCNVYRSTVSGGEAGPPIATGLLAAAFTDTNVTDGQTYFYTVTAINPALGGESPPSVEASTKPIYATTSTAYQSAMLAAAPAVWWRLNETNGALLYDSIGSRNGTNAGAVVLGVAGPRPPDFLGFEMANTAAQFANGTANSWINVPALNLNTNTVTITAWIYPTGATADYAGVCFYRSGGTVAGINYGGSVGANAGMIGYTWNNDQNTWNWTSGLTPSANQWSFVVLVVQPTSAIMYLVTTNGRQSATNTYAHPNQGFSGTGTIGTDAYDAAGRAFNGLIDEVAVFNHALTPAQIQSLFANGNQLSQANVGMQKSGANLSLTWPQGTLLQSSNLAGPWSRASASASPLVVAPTNGAVFYRVLLKQ